MIQPGDIANDHGDIHFSDAARPIAEGLICVDFLQALRAIPFGWRWTDVEFRGAEASVAIQRGGIAIRCRR
jgi:hypothetical protein